MKKSNEKNEFDSMESSMSSFCPNCGVMVKPESSMDDPNRNKVPCNVCAPILARFIDADLREQASEVEIDLEGVSGVARSAHSALSRKETADAKRQKENALIELRKRQSSVRTEYAHAIQNN